MIYDVTYVYVTTAMINFERYNYHAWITRPKSFVASVIDLNELHMWSYFRANFMHRVLFPSTHAEYMYSAKWRKSFRTPGAQFNHRGMYKFCRQTHIHGSDQRNVCAVYFLYNLRRSMGYGSYTEREERCSRQNCTGKVEQGHWICFKYTQCTYNCLNCLNKKEQKTLRMYEINLPHLFSSSNLKWI